VRIQSKIRPTGVFKVAKNFITVYFSMARTGNGNTSAIMHLALEKENESFSGATDEFSVRKGRETLPLRKVA